MKKTILLLLSSMVCANTNLGVVVWNAWHPKDNGKVAVDGDLLVSGKENYFGGALRLPFSFLMGSSLELGMSFLPNQTWTYGANSISVSDRKRYSLNTVYPVSDSISAMIGAYVQKNSLSCTSGCNFIEPKGLMGLVKGNVGWQAGLQWLEPVMSNLESGIRVLYTFGRDHSYCLGAQGCQTSFVHHDKRLMVQAVAMAGF